MSSKRSSIKLLPSQTECIKRMSTLKFRRNGLHGCLLCVNAEKYNQWNELTNEYIDVRTVNANGVKVDMKAHYVAYVAFHGVYPGANFELSHGCNNKRCCEVSHIVCETREVNLSRELCHMCASQGIIDYICPHEPSCIIDNGYNNHNHIRNAFPARTNRRTITGADARRILRVVRTRNRAKKRSGKPGLIRKHHSFCSVNEGYCKTFRSVCKNGYANFTYNEPLGNGQYHTTTYTMSRIVYCANNRSLGAVHMEVSHLCHNRACIRSSHLVLEDPCMNRTRLCCHLYYGSPGYLCPHPVTCFNCSPTSTRIE